MSATTPSYGAARYTERSGDLAHLQQRLVTTITHALGNRLGQGDEGGKSRHGSANAEAYRLYLLGRYQIDRSTDSSFEKARQSFQQAIDQDPNYAAAYAGLADALAILGYIGSLPAKEANAKAEAAAKRALALDSMLAEAHDAQGFVSWLTTDFAGAEREFRRAIELNPNLSIPHDRYHAFLKSLGRFKEAQHEVNQARALDPLPIQMGIAQADMWHFQRDYDRAMLEFKQLLRLDPNNARVHSGLAYVYAQKGMYDQEMDEIETALKLNGRPEVAAALRRAYTEAGLKGMLLKDIELKSTANHRVYSPASVAANYARLGNRDEAFQWLERAWNERTGWAYLKVQPEWDSLRSDPRFADLLRRIGFPQ